ncbi:MAG: hypothetical protein WA102_12470 [Candidatus Methanoperedens sp.]
MHYKELLKGVNAYASDDKNSENAFPIILHDEEKIRERSYLELVAYGRPTEKLVEDIRYFLREWNRRVPVDVEKLKEAIEQVPDYVKKWDIEKMDLWEYHEEITKIFQTFINTGKNRNNYTGASKTLHIFNPRFFAMWDSYIRDGYGCCENEEGYFNFLLRCQKEIEEIILTYDCDFPAGPEISQRIYYGHSKSIVKLLDEYNIAKYTNKWLTPNEEKDTTSIVREMREKSYDI